MSYSNISGDVNCIGLHACVMSMHGSTSSTSNLGDSGDTDLQKGVRRSPEKNVLVPRSNMQFFVIKPTNNHYFLILDAQLKSTKIVWAGKGGSRARLLAGGGGRGGPRPSREPPTQVVTEYLLEAAVDAGLDVVAAE